MARAKETKVTYTKAYLSFGFREMWFPIDTRLLLRYLPESGYAFTEPERIGVIPFKARLEIRGEDIARKGDLHLSIDTERQLIGIDGPDPETILSALKECEQFIEQRLSFKVESHVTFYELLADGYISLDKNVKELFREASSKLEFLQKVQDILGEQAELFGVRLGSSRERINDPDWFEIDLHPAIVTELPSSCEFSVVYRKPQREKVVKFAQGLPNILLKLIKYIEG